MGLTDRIARAWGTLTERDNLSPAPTFGTLGALYEFMNFNNNMYSFLSGYNQTLKGKHEEIEGNFAGLVQGAYKANGVVFACMLARMQLFAEARFQYQRLRGGRPGDLWGDGSLDVLEHPYPTATTGDLLARAIQDVDIGGTWYATRRRNAIRRMRPDWVTMILGSERDPELEAGDIDADVVAIAYHPGGKTSGRMPEFILRENLAIWAPIPDPVATYRGMSWLTPILREIGADNQMTDHKQAYLVNGATPNLVVSLDKDMKQAESPQAFKSWIEAFQKQNPSGNQWEKYKTWYLAGGTTVTSVGSNMEQLDFKAVQGAGETRIAAAAGVPPIIVGLSEGLASGTYQNYGQARRRFADNTMRPLWRNFAGSLEQIVPPPGGSRLWYDDRDIQALAEDKKDLAEVKQLEATILRTLTDAGFEPASIITAVQEGGDWDQLVHTGLYSVQLQAPGSTRLPQGEAPGDASNLGGPAQTVAKAPPKLIPPSREQLAGLLAARSQEEPA